MKTQIDEATSQLKRATKVKDVKLAGKALDVLRMNGLTYRDCYRIGLAGDATLTECEWEDFMADIDQAESK